MPAEGDSECPSRSGRGGFSLPRWRMCISKRGWSSPTDNIKMVERTPARPFHYQLAWVLTMLAGVYFASGLIGSTYVTVTLARVEPFVHLAVLLPARFNFFFDSRFTAPYLIRKTSQKGIIFDAVVFCTLANCIPRALLGCALHFSGSVLSNSKSDAFFDQNTYIFPCEKLVGFE